MKPKTPLPQLLSAAHPHTMDGLPSSIRIPAADLRGPDEVVRPLEEATIDDVAFAVLAIESESRAVYRRLSALRALYELARKRGALGADTVSHIFAELREGGRT